MSEALPTQEQIRELLVGSIDIHVHAAPDSHLPRRADAIELAEHAVRLRMGGFVLKNHHESTAAMAKEVQARFSELTIVGGLVLNESVGGLDPRAVERAALAGGKVLWFPTQSAAAHLAWKGTGGGISILDDAGKLVAPVDEILEVARAHDLVVETGHLSTPECRALVRRAIDMGIERVVVTHGNTMHFLTGMTSDDMKALAEMGAFVEYCFHTCMPMTFRLELKELAKMMAAVPEDRVILSTDFGQVNHPIAGEGMWMGVASLLMVGFSESAVRSMVRDNPRRLLG